jgi:hypothetical protein
MMNNSTDKTNNYLSPNSFEHKKDYDIRHYNLGPGFTQIQNCGRVKPFNRIPSPLDN